MQEPKDSFKRNNISINSGKGVEIAFTGNVRERIEGYRKRRIDEIATAVPNVSRSRIEEDYDKDIAKTTIPLAQDGEQEIGLNRVMGSSELKHLVSRKVLVPLMDVMEGDTKVHGVVPTGINFFGTRGSGKTYFAEALGEHYEAKGGYFEKLELAESKVATEQNFEILQRAFQEAEERYRQSGKKKYTMILLDEAEKYIDRAEPANGPVIGLLRGLVDNCKDRGVVFITTGNSIDRFDPGFLRQGRTDQVFPMRGIEDYELADTIKFYFEKNDITNNFDDEDYQRVIDDVSQDRETQVYKPGSLKRAIEDEWGQVQLRGGIMTAENLKNVVISIVTDPEGIGAEDFEKLTEDTQFVLMAHQKPLEDYYSLFSCP